MNTLKSSCTRSHRPVPSLAVLLLFLSVPACDDDSSAKATAGESAGADAASPVDAPATDDGSLDASPPEVAATAVPGDAAADKQEADGGLPDVGPNRLGFEYLDRSYGSGGIVMRDITSASDYPQRDVIVRSDDSVVFVNPVGCALVSLTPDGRIDETFGPLGVRTPVPDLRCYKLLSAPNGGFFLQATRLRPDGQPLYGAVVVRLTSDFAVDETFGEMGRVVVEHLEVFNDMYVDASGNLILFGNPVYGIDPTAKETGTNYALVRVTASGIFDRTFGTEGFLIFPMPGTQFARKIVALPDGNFRLIGGSDRADERALDILVTQLKPDFSIDTSFGEQGHVVSDLKRLGKTAWEANRGDHVMPQTDLSMIIAGSVNMHLQGKGGGVFGPLDVAAYRLLPDGSVDTTFGSNGMAYFDIGGADLSDRIHRALVQPDGKIVMVGVRNEKELLTADTVIVRLLPSGALDTSFGKDGVIVLDVSKHDYGNTVDLLSDGSLLVGGAAGMGVSASHAFYFTRIRP